MWRSAIWWRTRGGDDVDELLAVEDPREVVLVEDLLGSRQAERGARDHDGLAVGGALSGAAAVAQELAAPLERVGEDAAEREEGGVRRARGARRRGFEHRDGRRRGGGGRRRGGGLGRRGRRAEAGGVEAAERDVERRQVAALRMVRVEVQRLIVAEHVAREALQRALGARLDEHAGALVPERVQAGDELHRRGDLPAEEVHDALDGVRARRVEATVDVGDNRDPRRRELQPAQRGAQRLARGGDDLRVERVADGQQRRLVAVGLQALDHGVHGLARTAEDDLLRRVDVRQHDVPVGLGDDRLDDLGRGGDRGHRTRVAERRGSPSRARAR